MIAAFLFAFVASFWGSVPPGPGNLAVLHTVLNKNSKAGVWLAFGASVPELPYSFISVLAIDFATTFTSFSLYLETGTMLALLGIGIVATFFQKSAEVSVDTTSKVEKFQIHPFWKGVLIAFLNPMLIAFWLVTSHLAVQYGWLHVEKLPHKLAFVIGTAAGAFVFLFLVAIWTNKIKQRLTLVVIGYLNKAIGITFLTLGIIQAIRLLIRYI